MRLERFQCPRAVRTGGGCLALAVGLTCLALSHPRATASPPGHGPKCHPGWVHGDALPEEPWAGTWYWLRSPEQEKQVITSYYNRYCLRCHAVDGRGVWDMPDVPDFTNARWQASRSDLQLTRLILQGRGAVMPAFRGTLTLEEAAAMARYLRTFIPGTEASKPDFREEEKPMEKLPPKGR